MKYWLLLAMTISNAALSNSINYPLRATALRIEGEVQVLYDINDSGYTENIRVIEARPKDVFERQVMMDILRWRFKPGEQKKDIPLKVSFQIKPNL
jgi:protein TonB